MPDPTLPDPINVVLTFDEPGGKRWIAGALLGPLHPYGDKSQILPVSEMPDRALTVVGFSVVRHGPS